MTITFGPELVGQTEKTLNALLRLALDGTGLTERHWVTLRVAERADGGDLAERVRDRARFEDAATLVETLTTRGLLYGGELTDAGRRLITDVRERTTAQNGRLWEDLPDADVAGAERVLNAMLQRAREVLADAATAAVQTTG